MRFAFMHRQKDVKPGCLILALFPRDISVFHLSYTATNQLKQANSFAPFIRDSHPRIKD
jgi:hypothetical protein